MALEIEQFPCRSDNFGVLLHDPASGATALVDAPEEAPILAAVERTGWRPTMILTTHHHPDHVFGNSAFLAEAYARGLDAALHGDHAGAKKYFEICLDHDPGLAWPRLGLAIAQAQVRQARLRRGLREVERDEEARPRSSCDDPEPGASRPAGAGPQVQQLRERVERRGRPSCDRHRPLPRLLSAAPRRSAGTPAAISAAR